jgi:hypothetical protein
MWRWWPAAALIAAALLPAACLRPTLFPPPPDDGLCRGPLGQARELGAEPVTAVATDGQQLFAVHTKDGSLWSRPLGGGQGTGRRLAERIAPGAAAGARGWLVASGAHVYWRVLVEHRKGQRSPLMPNLYASVCGFVNPYPDATLSQSQRLRLRRHEIRRPLEVHHQVPSHRPLFLAR